MKTKEQLLKACINMGACWPAIEHISRHPSRWAYPIIEGMPEWQLWFLSRRLTKEGLELLARRLDVLVADFYISDTQGRPLHDRQHRKDFLRSVFYHLPLNSKDGQRVINDCWRSWCRSGGKS